MSDKSARRKRRRRPATPEAAVRRALRALARASEAFAAERRATLPETLRVDLCLTDTDDSTWRQRGDAFVETLESAVIAAPDAVEWRDGAMFCFQCDSARCGHAVPPNPRHVFTGYPPTGKPTWTDFLEMCVQRRPEGLDRLFHDRPGVVVFAESADDLTEGLLPGFGRGAVGYTVLGQVTVGLISESLGVVSGDGRAALTIQIVETRSGVEGERLRLNLIGFDRQTIIRAAADGAPRNPAEQLRRTLDRTRQTLGGIERRLRNAGARREAVEPEGLVGPVLSRLRSDLGRIFSPDARRTRHAESRHRGGARPTSTAWDDARSAGDERLMADAHRGTIIVLGPRSRAHVFSRAGRHVTSLRLDDGELARKTATRRWAPLAFDDIKAFRAVLDAAGGREGRR